jgi:hypothetical protein
MAEGRGAMSLYSDRDHIDFRFDAQDGKLDVMLVRLERLENALERVNTDVVDDRVERAKTVGLTGTIGLLVEMFRDRMMS